MDIIAALALLVLLVLGALCVFFLVCIQPIWGIVDVAASKEQSGGVKAVVIILTLVLLGPLMTIGYAFFGTRSTGFRMTTVVTLTVLLSSGLYAVGLALAVPATQGVFGVIAQLASDAGLNVSAYSARGSGTAPDPAGEQPSGSVGASYARSQFAPFPAIHLVPTSQSSWSASIAKFSGQGPTASALVPLIQPSIYPISHLAIDFSKPSVYAMTTHSVGRIAPATGEFIELGVDPAVGKPSRPSAIAFDSKQGLLLIAARSTGYSYNPSTGEWKRLEGLKDDNIVALEYVEDLGVVYGLRSKPGGRQVTKLIRVSPDGSLLEEKALSMPIPVGIYPHTMAQLCHTGDELIVVVSATSERGATEPCHQTLFSIDPSSGICLPFETQIASGVGDPSKGG